MSGGGVPEILVGLAAGDMLGAPTEFLTPSQVEQQYGEITGPVAQSFGNYEAGQFTDDTQMALCLLEAHPVDDGLVRRAKAALCDWQRTGPRDIGILTQSALDTDPVSAWRASGLKSCGNGALVRSAASVAAGLNGEKLLETAVKLGAITHSDPRSIICSAILCNALSVLHEGAPYRDAWLSSLEAVARAPIPEWLLDHGDNYASDVTTLLPESLREIKAAVLSGLSTHGGGNSGYAVATLQTAIAHGSADSFGGGVFPIIRSGGDSDSIAAVCGAILGARGILPPLEWLTEIRSAEVWSAWPKDIWGKSALLRFRQACARASGHEFMCKRFHPQIVYGRQPVSREDAALLSRLGVTHVLDLRPESEAEEAGRRGGHGVIRWPEHSIERGNVPIPDGGAPSRGAFERTHEFIDRALSLGGTTYVHCRAGIERTGTVMLAWWLRRGGSENAFYNLATQVSPLPHQVEAALRWAYDE